MSRIPVWLYLLFGPLAVAAGILGVIHAPAGVPKTSWAIITILGVASLASAGYRCLHRNPDRHSTHDS